MKYGDDYKQIPATSKQSGKGIEVLSDLYMFTVQIVNLFFIGYPEKNKFVLVDAGTPNKSEDIIKAIAERFGPTGRPEAIILTHGHFDHVGSIIELVQQWNVPVYAHELELPYLTGKKSYPKPDFTVQGGLVAKMSPLFPITPIDLGSHITALPPNGEVPYLPDFKWIHVPGHSPGQIALFREKDRTLIAADAFVTVKQENLYKVLTQKQEISGPPRYLTTEWKAAKNSVQILERLEPRYAITGHGLPMEGKTLRENLAKLANEFDDIAVPKHGKYV